MHGNYKQYIEESLNILFYVKVSIFDI